MRGTGGSYGSAGTGQGQFVEQVDRDHEGLQVVITVVPLRADIQVEVYLGGCFYCYLFHVGILPYMLSVAKTQYAWHHLYMSDEENKTSWFGRIR